MAAKVGAIQTNGLYAACFQRQTRIAKGDVCASLQRGDRLCALECNWLAFGCDDADDVFMHWQSGVDIADGKN